MKTHERRGNPGKEEVKENQDRGRSKATSRALALTPEQDKSHLEARRMVVRADVDSPVTRDTTILRALAGERVTFLYGY